MRISRFNSHKGIAGEQQAYFSLVNFEHSFSFCFLAFLTFYNGWSSLYQHLSLTLPLRSPKKKCGFEVTEPKYDQEVGVNGGYRI